MKHQKILQRDAAAREQHHPPPPSVSDPKTKVFNPVDSMPEQCVPSPTLEICDLDGRQAALRSRLFRRCSSAVTRDLLDPDINQNPYRPGFWSMN
jgi:hypothetical protein